MLSEIGLSVFNSITEIGSHRKLFLDNMGRAIFNETGPSMTILSNTRNKISDETGYTTSVVTFESSTDLIEWEARADGAGVGQGDLVGSGGQVEALDDIQFEVDYDELGSGDKEYRINLYGRNTRGWSPYES